MKRSEPPNATVVRTSPQSAKPDCHWQWVFIFKCHLSTSGHRDRPEREMPFKTRPWRYQISTHDLKASHVCTVPYALPTFCWGAELRTDHFPGNKVSCLSLKTFKTLHWALIDLNQPGSLGLWFTIKPYLNLEFMTHYCCHWTGITLDFTVHLVWAWMPTADVLWEICVWGHIIKNSEHG